MTDTDPALVEFIDGLSPHDFTGLAVAADLAAEVNDPAEAGLRELARLRRWPYSPNGKAKMRTVWANYTLNSWESVGPDLSELPPQWFEAVRSSTRITGHGGTDRKRYVCLSDQTTAILAAAVLFSTIPAGTPAGDSARAAA